MFPAPGVELLLSTDLPRWRCSVDPLWCSSSVMSPVGVVASVPAPLVPVPVLRDDVKMDLDFQESNLLELALRVIFEMNVGRDAVAGVDSRLLTVPGREERPEVVRSSDSRDSMVDVVGAMECVSFDLRDSGGDPERMRSSLTFVETLSFSLVLSLLLPKPNMLKAGALGLSLGVNGRC